MEQEITLQDIKNAKTPEEKMEMAKKLAQQNERKSERGRLELSEPLKDGDREFTELKYDFMKLTGVEYAEAMDEGIGSNRNSFKISNAQALRLFCAAAAKCQDGLFPNDIQDGLSMADALAAINISTLFFTTASRAANFRIMSM